MSFVPLVSIADVQLGKMLSPKSKTGTHYFPYLRNTNVQWGRIEISDLARMDFSETERRKFDLRYGDLLVCEGGEPGRCAIWRNELADCYYQKAIHRVRPHEGKADAEFLSLWIMRQAMTGAFEDQNAKTTIAHLPQVRLEQLPVPDIGADNQRLIAARLNDQLAAVDDTRQAAQTQLAETTRLIHSIIRESVEHPDTEPASLGEVLEEVKRGIGSGWARFPVLGATRDGLAPAKEPVGKNPERYKPVVPGTVFYNPMRIMIGSIAMADEDDAPGITSPDYVVLRGREGKVDSRWFYHWLRAPEGEHCIASLARGAVRERMLFNRLAEGEIELPPYPVQMRASKALAEVRHMRAAIEAQLQEIESMPARLLAQAFDEYDA
jgi:type I restriction enzyme, S subunit